ncbi:winged helix-turn-helix transcriptional regulator [Kribbella sp. NPDC051587]|uniref:winged helix-turn-helix transcriptional regulator n=1 Tax=Kribbella sp. NPDC051587 TaxID=3364119 RepID=UPI0037BC3FA0
MLALFELRDGAKGFNELRRTLAPITQRMLSTSLRNLESAGLVTRTVYPTLPPQVEYAVTAAGKDLLAIVGQIEGWVTTYRG